MAQFVIVSQVLDAVDPKLGPVSEELRTLQVKRPVSAVERIQARAKWEKFGKAKGKGGGVTDVLKEDIVIEPPSGLWGLEDDDKVAQRLISAAGRVTISVQSASNTPTPGHSRRNSGSNSAGLPIEESTVEGGSRTESTGSVSEEVLPQPSIVAPIARMIMKRDTA